MYEETSLSVFHCIFQKQMNSGNRVFIRTSNIGKMQKRKALLRSPNILLLLPKIKQIVYLLFQIIY